LDAAQREAAEAMIREMAALEREKAKQVEIKRVMERERDRQVEIGRAMERERAAREREIAALNRETQKRSGTPKRSPRSDSNE
jgi:hypothetical protein